jgi:biotin transport system substrate-specific component
MLGNKSNSLLIAYTAVFIALLAASSWISIPVPPIPFTLQTLAVFLCAAIMRRYAVIPLTLYVMAGCLNLPVFHNGTAGIGVLFGPSGGFLIGFIPAVLVAGYLYESDKTSMHIAGLFLAMGIYYLFGVGWIMLSTGMNLVSALFAGFAPFIIGDIIKLILAFSIAKWVERIHPIQWS